jgi:hypothetical protein
LPPDFELIHLILFFFCENLAEKSIRADMGATAEELFVGSRLELRKFDLIAVP